MATADRFASLDINEITSKSLDFSSRFLKVRKCLAKGMEEIQLESADENCTEKILEPIVLAHGKLCEDFQEMVENVNFIVQGLRGQIEQIRELLQKKIKEVYTNRGATDPYTIAKRKVSLCEDNVQAWQFDVDMAKLQAGLKEAKIKAEAARQEARHLLGEPDHVGSTMDLQPETSPLLLSTVQADECEVYKYYVDPGNTNVDLGCIVRAKPGTLRNKNILTVKRLEESTIKLQTEHREELVSNIINISLTNSKEKLQLLESLAVAIPHCAPKTKFKEPVIKQLAAYGNWMKLKSFSVCFQKPDDKYDFLEAKLDDVEATLAIVTYKKNKTFKVLTKGGRIRATEDPRVRVDIKPGTFKTATSVSLGVDQVDEHFITLMKDKNPTYEDQLLASSPFVTVATDTQRLNQPVNVSLPMPSEPPGRSSMNENRRSTKQDGTFRLLATSKGSWSDKTDVVLNTEKDGVSFEMRETPFERFIVLKTPTRSTAKEREDIVTQLDLAVHQKECQVFLGQKRLNHREILISCTAEGSLERMRGALQTRGFDITASSNRIALLEGQEVTLRFGGNIESGESGQKRFCFHSNLQNEIIVKVREKNTHSQTAQSRYSGNIALYAKIGPQVSSQKPTDAYAEQKLCEFKISIPKLVDPNAEPEHDLLVKDDVLTQEVLRRLAGGIGKEWPKVASRLKVDEASIQSIQRRNQGKPTARTIYDILVKWLNSTRSAPASMDKVHFLCQALNLSGRKDLEKMIREIQRKVKR